MTNVVLIARLQWYSCVWLVKMQTSYDLVGGIDVRVKLEATAINMYKENIRRYQCPDGTGETQDEIIY